MRQFWSVLILAVAFLVATASVHADDMVRYLSGQENEPEQTATGRIRTTTPETVTITENGKDRVLAANVVLWTQFDREPVSMTTARTFLQTSRFEKAIERLEATTPAERKALSPLAAAEYDYLVAKAAALRALTLRTQQRLLEAGPALVEFNKKYPESWHQTEIDETIGAILLALGKLNNAKVFFDKLAARPWPDVKLKALNASADISLREKKYDDARQAFEQAVGQTGSETPAIREQKLYAKIGLCRVLTAQKQYDESVKALKAVISETRTGDAPMVLARLYNALGEAYSGAGSVKEAILAYLHTDLLYPTAKIEHVQALRALRTLWKQDSREDRAAEVERILRNEYKITDAN